MTVWAIGEAPSLMLFQFPFGWEHLVADAALVDQRALAILVIFQALLGREQLMADMALVPAVGRFRLDVLPQHLPQDQVLFSEGVVCLWWRGLRQLRRLLGQLR